MVVCVSSCGMTCLSLDSFCLSISRTTFFFCILAILTLCHMRYRSIPTGCLWSFYLVVILFQILFVFGKDRVKLRKSEQIGREEGIERLTALFHTPKASPSWWGPRI